MGVVYHSNYLIRGEIGRTDYIRALGRPYTRLRAGRCGTGRGRGNHAVSRPGAVRRRHSDRDHIDRDQVRTLTFDYVITHAETGARLVSASTILVSLTRMAGSWRFPPPCARSWALVLTGRRLPAAVVLAAVVGAGCAGTGSGAPPTTVAPVGAAPTGVSAGAAAPVSVPTRAPAATLADTDVARYATLLAMADARQPDSAGLVRAIRSKSSPLRVDAVRAVGQLHVDGLAPKLRQLLRDRDTTVAATAAFSLGLLRDTESVIALAAGWGTANRRP